MRLVDGADELGRVFEVFTRETPPRSSAGSRSTATVFSSEPSSSGAALDLRNEDRGGPGDDDERDRRQKLLRRCAGKNRGHYRDLQGSGLPPSLCRLVTHMLDNDTGDGLFVRFSTACTFSAKKLVLGVN